MKPLVREASGVEVMPPRLRLGDHAQTTMLHHILRWRNFTKGEINGTPAQPIPGRRYVMGYLVPTWQRGLVWSDEQATKLLESAWRGVSIGTMTYNQIYKPWQFDGLLIDGQQRLYAVQRYLQDEFPVFGYRWSEVSDADRRRFEFNTHFSAYITSSDDEEYLKGYYNMMNFGGTAHTEGERAT